MAVKSHIKMSDIVGADGVAVKSHIKMSDIVGLHRLMV